MIKGIPVNVANHQSHPAPQHNLQMQQAVSQQNHINLKASKITQTQPK